MTDPIADFITRIRNAGMAMHSSVRIPHSKMKVSMAKILKDEGYIEDFEVDGDSLKKDVVVHLRYGADNKSAIRSIKRVSKSGRRVYKKMKNIPLVNQGLGVAILSTSQGLLTDKDARRLNLGGEVVCEIW
ncbi:MAG: 30S ribosomal protein S8 [Proteobacteria bacterium]|jgi:small subunit ribosomal protein S8|nr:30S ribosomal protein S8 [Pseudomonadota bacterium]NLN61634.1 30S ribosomal protein S8 [Myxococcales bacterium]